MLTKILNLSTHCGKVRLICVSSMCLEKLPNEVRSLLHRHGLLNELVARHIRSEMVCNIQLTDVELDDLHKLLFKKFSVETIDELEKHVNGLGLTMDETFMQASLQIKIKKYSHLEFVSKAEAHFLVRKSDLDSVVYSLLRLKDPGLANELFLQISGGEADFAELSARYSEGSEQKTRGIVGPGPMAKAHPQLRKLLLTAKAGVVMPPIYVETWYLIVRLESHIPAVFDDSMAELMELELFNLRVQSQSAELFNSLLPTFLV